MDHKRPNFFANLKTTGIRLTDDKAHGGGDGHYSPGQTHGRVVHSLGRAHDKAAAHPGSCETNKKRTNGQTKAGGVTVGTLATVGACLSNTVKLCLLFLTHTKKEVHTHTLTLEAKVLFSNQTWLLAFFGVPCTLWRYSVFFSELAFTHTQQNSRSLILGQVSVKTLPIFGRGGGPGWAEGQCLIQPLLRTEAAQLQCLVNTSITTTPHPISSPSIFYAFNQILTQLLHLSGLCYPERMNVDSGGWLMAATAAQQELLRF